MKVDDDIVSKITYLLDKGRKLKNIKRSEDLMDVL